MDAISEVPPPRNETVRDYAAGSPERARLAARVAELAGQCVDLPCTLAGDRRLGAGQEFDVVAPHEHARVLGRGRQATREDVGAALTAALVAGPAWRALSFDARAAVFLRAAELLSGPWRDTINAATMLGQSKSCYQAEIDAACELTDFFRFNVAFARRLLTDQPLSASGTWNRVDHRPLEGFVLAITPFNFTSIAGNLPTAPALLGNTVVWKPATTQLLAAHYTMALLEAAGLPPGVVNLVTGGAEAVSAVALVDPHLAGVHFTGSTATFQYLWRTVGERIAGYRTYPRLVGETGGKDFVLAHPSADPAALVTALVRGAFDYQGQKCSAASRAYVPRSLWTAGVRAALAEAAGSVRYGDVADLGCYGGAVIDAAAFARLAGVLERARRDPDLEVLVGGSADATRGYFVDATVLVGADPAHEVFREEYFGPILAVYVYDDRAPDAWPDVLALVDSTSAYGLTGAVFADDRAAAEQALAALRFAAGNIYLNDKPTGAVVGQQPFGGARASGTNDKAGSIANLARWVSPRALKESFVPATSWRYPHMSGC